MSGGIRTSVEGNLIRQRVTFVLDTVHEDENENFTAPKDPPSLPETTTASTSYGNSKIPCLLMMNSAAQEKSQNLKNNSERDATKDRSKLDSIIKRLLEVRISSGNQFPLSESEVTYLCLCSREIFLKQPNLLELEAPITVCGCGGWL